METNTTKPDEAPSMCGVRLSEDTRILLTAARKNGEGKSWSDVINKTLRAHLTPKYGGKLVANIQEKLGVA